MIVKSINSILFEPDSYNNSHNSNKNIKSSKNSKELANTFKDILENQIKKLNGGK